MRVVFLGFQTWGTVALEAILSQGHDVPLVITHAKSSHEYECLGDSVENLARRHRLPLIECSSINRPEMQSKIASARSDLLVMSNWRTWISREAYSCARYGALNIHDALLPRYAGFCPINWAVANGETETGVTVHFVNDHYDLGDIVVQEEVEIGFSETATDVYHKIIGEIPRLTIQALRLIEEGRVKPIPQDRAESTFYHKRCVRDGLINWNQSCIGVYNLIRAQSDPYPNAFTYHARNRLKIKKASLPDRAYRGTPGRLVRRLDSGVVVICGSVSSGSNQGLVLEQVQAEDGRVVEANAYFERMGEQLGSGSGAATGAVRESSPV